MAWTLVKKQTHLCSSGQSKSDNEVTKTATDVYVCVSDTATTPAAAEAAVGIALGAPYSGDGSRVCKGIEAKPDENSPSKVFNVTVTYETLSDDEEEDEEEEENPLARPDEVSFEASSTTEPIFEDESQPDKKSIVNSAGEPFDKFFERTTGEIELTITGNRSSFNAAQAAQYTKPSAVNSDAFTVRGISVGAGEGKMVGISATLETENDVTFWKVTWRIALAPNWDLVVEDRGYNELSTDAGAKKGLKPIVRGTPATQVDKPFPLDGAGKSKANSTDKPEILTFKPYPKKSFGVFSWTA